MSLEIVPYKKELLKDFVYNGVELKLSDIQIDQRAEFFNKFGESYIGLVDGKVLGVGGIYCLWANTGSAWLFLNKEARVYKKSVFKALLEYMNMLLKKYDIKTLIVECMDDSMEAHRLIQHLGFVKSKEVKMSIYFKSSGA